MRVLIVEDEPWLRDAVRAAFAARFTEVRVAETVAAVSALLAQGFPFDAALVDLGLPDGHGLDLLPRLSAARPDAGLVVFTIFEDAETVCAALRAGARGYLLKSTPVGELANALEEVSRGGSPLSPSVARLVVDAFRSLEPAASPMPRLSDRERDLLTLLARGHTYADAGTALGIRIGTVQSYVKSLYEKLAVASKAEAAIVAARMGLLR